MKTYYGGRGSGKTIKLLREAAKAVINGKTVCFVVLYEGDKEMFKEKAMEMFGETIANKIRFYHVREVKNELVEKDMIGRNPEQYKILIDEAQHALINVLFEGNRNLDIDFTVDTDEAYSEELNKKL